MEDYNLINNKMKKKINHIAKLVVHGMDNKAIAIRTAEWLEVTADTIRRDVRYQDKEGEVKSGYSKRVILRLMK